VPLPIVARITCATVLLRRLASRRRRGELRRRARHGRAPRQTWRVSGLDFQPPEKTGPPAVHHLAPSVHAGDNCFQLAAPMC